ncbi:MAG: putative rane protein [Clostridiales bacterium]|jgi:stage III sporulation protein AF|nr:putative rane protein [Clostridiales bacterium]
MAEWLQNIFIYIILMTIIIGICPKGQYEKIVRFFAGMVLVFVVINPILKIGNIENLINNFVTQNKFEYNMQQLKDNQKAFEEEQLISIINIYKSEIATQITIALEKENLYVRNIEINIDEKTESEDFGKILLINIGADTSNLKSSNTIKVDQIIISTETSTEVKTAEEIIYEKKVKEVVMKLYNLSVEKIIVKIYVGDE